MIKIIIFHITIGLKIGLKTIGLKISYGENVSTKKVLIFLAPNIGC